jgi:hypothetical protein
MDFENRLHEMQNIPSSGDTLSLAEKFFKRGFRSNLPTLDKFFNPIQIYSEGRKRFQIGDHVRIQNAVSKLWNDSGLIRDIRDSGRSYYIDRGPGRDVIFRNNIFLKLIAPPVAKRAGEGLSDSLALAEQQDASLQARGDSPMHALRRSKRITKLHVPLVPAVPIQIENKYLAKRRSLRIEKGENNVFSSGSSLREKHAVKTHISSGSLPLHRPAVAKPAAIEPKLLVSENRQ